MGRKPAVRWLSQRDYSLSVIARLTEAVEVELGAGQIDGGVEPQCQLTVR